MKKWITLLLTVFLSFSVLVLGGCKGDEQEKTPPVTEQPSEDNSDTENGETPDNTEGNGEENTPETDGGKKEPVITDTPDELPLIPI